MKERIGCDLDGEVRRERPSEGIVVGSSFPRGVFGGIEKGGAHHKSAIDEEGLIGIRREGIEKVLEGEMEGERRGIGEGKECVEEMLHLAQIMCC